MALLTASTNLVLRVFGIKGEAEPNLTEDEIKALISQGAETGAVGATEENIVQRVFQLGDQRVAAIMTPRPDIEWIDVDAGEEELREFLASHAHTQFVVCHGGLDERARHRPLGRPAAAGVQGRARSICASLTREALFVPDSMPAVQLLESFRSSHKHVALVMDEYGAVEGPGHRHRPADGDRRRPAGRRQRSARARSCRAPTARGWSTARRRWKR